mgnify:CR=1 FL=1
MRKTYIAPSIYIAESEPVHALAASLPVDNEGEHDGWADAKPRSDNKDADLSEEVSGYGDLWR